jgi:arylsulfatase A-like enzyme
LETTLFSPFGQSLSVQQHARDYIQMEGILNALVTDTRLGLVYAHLPAPHFPFVYDPATNKLTRKNVTVRGYLDELALLNRTVAGLRKILEDSGTWDETIVLLTSDHRFRDSESLDGKSDPRVPFLLKMRGQYTRLSLDAQFNTVTVGELVLAMLQGDVSTPAQAAGWLQKNSR